MNFKCFIVSASRSSPGLGSDTASRSPPGRGHRFAQSAVPWKYVAFQGLCVTLLHFCLNLRPLLTHLFVLWLHFWRTRGTLFSFQLEKGHTGHPTPLWCSPISFHILGAILMSVFWHVQKGDNFAVLSMLLLSHLFNGFLRIPCLVEPQNYSKII